MRENTKWIMLVTALAFVVLMVFQWGMDITGRSSGSLGEIGTVNGTAVRYEDYMAVYRNLYDQAQARQQDPITTTQNKELEDAAWEQMVDRILLSDELRRRGIAVTDEEIRQAARFQPPPELRGSPAFQTDGQFDLVKYQQYLTNSQDPVLFQQLEAYYRDVLPQGKLMRQVATGLYLTDAELWERFKDVQETAQVRFVSLDPALRVPDDSVTVTDAEVEDYWEENQEEFEQPARAVVKVISLPRTPTAADSAAARLRATALLAEARAGANFDSVGAREARAARPIIFEDLGTFPRGRMMAPFDTAAFTAPIGQATGPVETTFGYHVLLVSARTADSATAKHMLVQVARTEESEDSLLTIADSLENLAEDQTMEEVARIMGLQIRTDTVNAEQPFIPDIGPVPEGTDWAVTEAAPGDVSELFENSDNFYLFELVSSTPGGIQPLEEVTPRIRDQLILQKKLEVAKARAQRLVERVRGGATLDDAAGEQGLDVREAGPFTRSDFVPTLGMQNAAIGAAFGLEAGKVSDAVATRDNVFVLEKIAHTPADSLQWVAQKEVQRRQLTSLLQQQRVQEWIGGLRAAARIVDRREEVLTPATDTTAMPLTPYGF